MRLTVGRAARRRERRLIGELPDALDRLAADLRSGATVFSGLEAAARAHGPLADEIRHVVGRVEAGEPLAEALSAWGRGRPLVAVTAGALAVAAFTGGRSATALEGLATGLRDRRRLADEVSALSAQSRLSAGVVAGAPLASLGFSLVVDPRVGAALFATSAGRACLLTGLGLEALAGFWMRRIIRGHCS